MCSWVDDSPHTPSHKEGYATHLSENNNNDILRRCER